MQFLCLRENFEVLSIEKKKETEKTCEKRVKGDFWSKNLVY